MARSLIPHFPTLPRQARAIGIILAYLRSDPTVQAVPVTIWAPEGDPLKIPPAYNPLTADLPAIRLLMPSDYAMGWEMDAAHLGRLVLNFELWTAGASYTEIDCLWEVFRNAIFPESGSARRNALEGELNGVPGYRNRTLTQGRTAVRPGSENEALVWVAAAGLRLAFNVET